MSNKSASAPRSSFSARLVARVKVFSASLSDQAVIDAGVGLFIIVALSILLLRDYQRPRIDQLPAGSVAALEIIAPEDLRIEDPSETRLLRDQAFASVSPVFDFNVRAARSGVLALKDVGLPCAPAGIWLRKAS